MRTKCHSCLCRTCLVACCGRKNKINCPGKKESCEDYRGFQQVCIFEPPPQPQYQEVPRYSWGYYGLDDKTYRKKLHMTCQSGKYDRIIRQVAYQANEDIAEYIVKSVTQDKSYDVLEFDGELGRISYGRSDFYGIRRRFFYLFDLELKKNGIEI